MIHGILNVYKEKEFTSHDVVAKLRGILKQKKIGHTGTLDPMAEGVLPVCLGKGTKLCDMFTEKDKTYQTVMLLGRITDTQDCTGTTLLENTVSVTEESVRNAVSMFVGEYMQIPPMYSALKVQGKKLYELAREGKTIPREPRKVTIFDIQIEDINLKENLVTMTVSCTKGTYIRTLCEDIGEVLSCGACMKELTRTRVGQFFKKDSLTLTEIEALVRKNQIETALLPVDACFFIYPSIVVANDYRKLIYNGNSFQKKHIEKQEEALQSENSPEADQRALFRVYDGENHFIGIYRFRDEEKCYTPVKMFYSE